MVYIVITDFDCFDFVYVSTVYRLPEKYTFGFIAHEVDFSRVKIVTTGVTSIKHGPKARVSQH